MLLENGVAAVISIIHSSSSFIMPCCAFSGRHFDLSIILCFLKQTIMNLKNARRNCKSFFNTCRTEAKNQLFKNHTSVKIIIPFTGKKFEFSKN